MSNIRQYFVDALPTALPGFRGSSHNHGKFLWQLIVVCTLAQVTAARDSVTTIEDLISVRTLTDGSSILSTLTSSNHSYLTDSSKLSRSEDELKLDSNTTDSLTKVEDRKTNLQRQDDLPQFLSFLQNFTELHYANATASNKIGLEHKLSAFQGQRSNCTFSKDTLVNLIHVWNVTSNPMIDAGISNCNFSVDYDSISCEELMKLIQCRISYLKSDFELDLAKNLTHLQETVLKLSKYAESSCIAQIAGGKIDEAFEIYKDLKYDSKLSMIIKSVYNEYGGNEKIVNILDFINKLDSCSKFQIAYGELFKAISDWDIIPYETLFYFYGEIARHSGCNCSSLLTWKNNLEIKVDRIIVRWSGQFQKGIYNQSEQIINYAKKPNLAYVTRSRLLPIFIQEAYSKVSSNTEKILEFIGRLPHIDQSVTSYLVLFNRLESFPEDLENHQLMLAYGIKRIMEMDDYPIIDQYYKDICTRIKDSLPSSVISLIWNGSNCTVGNRERNEYLSASTKLYDDYRQYVNTQISGNVEFNAYWTITTENLGQSFRFKNTYYNKYLYFPGDYYYYNGNRNYVFLCRGEPLAEESSWKLEPVDNARYFKLKNIKQERYLYSDRTYTINNDERFVFTWRDRNLNDLIMYSESQWVISC